MCWGIFKRGRQRTAKILNIIHAFKTEMRVVKRSQDGERETSEIQRHLARAKPKRR